MRHRRNSQAHSSGGRGLALALLVTAVWFGVELLSGFYTNSLALLADAAHMLTDLAALSLSLFALKISVLPPTSTKTYGYMRAEILAALANGVILVLVGLFIAYEAYQRLWRPPEVKSAVMLVVATIGLGANLIAARLLSHTNMENLNLRGAFLHVVGDMLGSAGAIIAAIVMLVWGWRAADPVVSAVVAMLILYSAWRLLRDSVDVLLEGVPRHLKVESILADLQGAEGVVSVHDLHVWSITSGKPALSCHVVLGKNADSSVVLTALVRLVRERHHIEHTTIQTEKDDSIIPL